MPLHSVLVHKQGPALWPDHKPLAEVLQLQATTPEGIWWPVYQGTPVDVAGNIYKRGWWAADQGTRYDIEDRGLIHSCYARYISLDTALKDKPEADTDFTAAVIGELWPDYRLAIRKAEVNRLEFPDLPSYIQALANTYNTDGKLRAVIIEDKASGTSALQTLSKTSPPWLQELLIPFLPTTDKITRAQQAAVWCRNGCILLPHPVQDLWWLVDLESELFDFPKAAHDDLADAFSQLVLYLENIIEAGWKARAK